MPLDKVDTAIVDATDSRTTEWLAPIGRPRYLMPIANAPFVDHVLAELSDHGIRKIRLVTVPALEESLAHAVKGRYRAEVVCGEPDGRRAVISEIRQALASGAVVLHPGNCLYRGQLGHMCARYAVGDVDVVLPAQASVIAARAPEARRVTDDVIVLGPGVNALLGELLEPASDGDDLLAALLTSECRLAVCAETQYWRYDDGTTSLLQANRMLLDALPFRDAVVTNGDGNRIDGRVDISASAYVTGSVVEGPVTVGDRAVVEDSYVGPYTAIGADTVLRGAEVANSMILAGAEVHHPGLRIVGSILGERASVARTFDLPTGLRLRLGPGSTIALS